MLEPRIQNLLDPQESLRLRFKLSIHNLFQRVEADVDRIEAAFQTARLPQYRDEVEAEQSRGNPNRQIELNVSHAWLNCTRNRLDATAADSG